ncbi:MAG TPA: prephenate dehydrogenase/arogenate dehydrogenase family protein, partial [Candidatus Defluviicoccus seviourii]|nr:prephenate dehydrogenase/arogenate dehydrogenase family protein [Candidatus Defluviicoccus seviourii]
MSEVGVPPHFRRVALIGIGLIGSSLARVIRRDGLADHIAVSARTQQTLDIAARLGLADSTSLDARKAVEGADLVVLSVPLGAYGSIASVIGSGVKPGAIVTDVGSVKECVIADVGPHLPEGVHLVPGHPVAGTEHSGPRLALRNSSPA